MSSETAQTFGITSVEPWTIQLSETMQVGQEVSYSFMKNCRTTRLKKTANPFVVTCYKDA